MRRCTVLAALIAAAVLSLAPATLFAQAGDEEEEEAPDFNYITVTRIRLPATQDRQKAMEWVDKVMVPVAQLDPNVLWYRIATHNWGSNSEDVLIMAEYDEWADIESDCPACDAWFEENQPEEDTPEREEWDAMAQAFFEYFSGHRDEIYATNMNRAKN